MERRGAVIIAVVTLEVISRAMYPYIGIDPLVYTLATRIAQVIVIFAFAFTLSGVRARSVMAECTVGLVLSLAFGAGVLVTDGAFRLAFDRGLLPLLLRKESMENALLFFFIGCVAAPFAEELFFRGLFYSWLRQKFSVIIAVIVSSLVFASAHGAFSPVQLIGGLVFAIVFEWRGSIWAPFVIHGLGNLGIWLVPHVYALLGPGWW
ncbi:MAG: CPBP family intramembrane glutamic endopeptidase [Desulfomonilia bacterium]